ncbi:Cytochrome P450 [Phytophthora cactorum]|nr:Cytochrome P450 [Phytophthora cactorum]
MLPISNLAEKSSVTLTATAIGGEDHIPDSTLPLIGNTWDLIAHAVKGDMHDFTTQLGKQFNAEPVVVQALGIPLNLILFTPEAFEDVLKTQFHNFEKGPFMCENLRDLLGEGIFAVDGDPWVHQRKTASNLFTMRTLRDSMTTVIQRHAVTLYKILQRASDNHKTVDLFKLFNRFTIEAFAEIGFGVHMGCLGSNEEHPFQKAFDRAQRALRFRFTRPASTDIEVIDKTVLEIVEKALAQRVSHGCKEKKGGDIVSLFLNRVSSSLDAEEHQLDPNYLRNIVVNFLIAGRDTTAQALSWFFFNLSKTPREIVDNLATFEIDGTPTMQDVSELVYLEAALKETLRLHPSVPVEPKQTLEDTTLSDGTFVPAGSAIGLATYAMGRMTKVWGPDAEEFKPNGGSTPPPFHIEVLNPEDVTYDLSLTLPVKGALNVKVSHHLWPAHA